MIKKNLQEGSIRSALEALREKGFIWKESLGGYVLEDESYLSMFGIDKGSGGAKKTINGSASPH